MSLAKINQETASTYLSHISYLNDRILKANAMIAACEIVKEYPVKGSGENSIKRDRCPFWKDPMDKLDREKAEKFQKFMLEEIEFFGYTTKFIKIKGYCDELRLGINEDLA